MNGESIAADHVFSSVYAKGKLGVAGWGRCLKTFSIRAALFGKAYISEDLEFMISLNYYI